MHTGIGTEAETATDNVVPVTFGKVVEVVAANPVAYDTIKDAGIEIVTSTNGTHRNDRLYEIALGEGTTIQFDPLRSTAVNEARTVEVNLILEHLGTLVNVVEDREVLIGATYDIGILEILDNGSHKLDGLSCMITAEINVVIDDGTCVTSLIEQSCHLIAHIGVEGIVGAKKDDVVVPYCGTQPVGTLSEGLLIEGVGGVIMVVEEGKRYGRLTLRVLSEVTVVNSIVAKERADYAAYPIVTNLADEA